jgi:uncharacterized membrane protein YoaK (UPF0700 family)
MQIVRAANPARPYFVALVYLVGLALCAVPTMWVLKWYGFAVPIVVAWCAVAAFTVYRSRKRALLGVTLGLLGVLLIVLLVAAAEWVPHQMIP